MRMIYYLVLTLLFMSQTIAAQGILDDPKAIFMDQNGSTLSREEAGEMLYSAQRYRLEKDNQRVPGKLVVTLIPISDREFEKLMKEDRKALKEMEGKPMNSFALSNMHGETISSEVYKGKTTVYNFWFTGCRPCIEELPQLNSLVDNYGDKTNFVAITFNDSGMVNKFLRKRKFNYSILVDANDLVREMNVTAYPTHIIVDEKGIVQKVFIGANESIGSKIENVISSL